MLPSYTNRVNKKKRRENDEEDQQPDHEEVKKYKKTKNERVIYEGIYETIVTNQGEIMLGQVEEIVHNMRTVSTKGFGLL